MCNPLRTTTSSTAQSEQRLPNEIILNIISIVVANDLDAICDKPVEDIDKTWPPPFQYETERFDSVILDSKAFASARLRRFRSSIDILLAIAAVNTMCRSHAHTLTRARYGTLIKRLEENEKAIGEHRYNVRHNLPRPDWTRSMWDLQWLKEGLRTKMEALEVAVPELAGAGTAGG